MKNKILSSFILAACGILFWMAAVELNGRWAGQINYNGSPVDLTYDFKTDGSKVTGTSYTPAGASEIKNGKIDNDQVSFNVDVHGETVPHTGKVYRDSISLKITFQGTEYTTTLKRSAK